MIPSSSTSRVVIVGCGFAGLSAAQTLARRGGPGLEIVVFNRTPTLYNYPILPRLLYETLPEEQVSLSLQRLLDGRRIKLHTERIEAIDLQQKTVATQQERLAYDYLILALGSRAVPLDKAEDVFVCYPKAARHLTRLRHTMEQQVAARGNGGHPLRYAVVGGGLTGVEFAAALRELSRRVCRGSGIDPRHIGIELLEREPQLLPGCHPALSRRIQRELAQEDITLRTGCRVDRVEAQGLITQRGEQPVDQVLCCIGSRPDLRPELHGLSGDGKAIPVERTLRIRQVDNAYGVGDSITFDGPATAELKRASHARDQGLCAAGNTLLQLRGGQPLPYRPRVNPTLLLLRPDRGILEYRGMTLGGRWAAALKRYLETRYCNGG